MGFSLMISEINLSIMCSILVHGIWFFALLPGALDFTIYEVSVTHVA